MTYQCDEKKAGEVEFRCYLQLAMMVIGGKWKPKVLFHLAQNEVVRFGALRRGVIGITEKMLAKAPLWNNVKNEIQILDGHHLIAHNSDFERSFLSDHFEVLTDREEKEKYEDSLLYLSLLFPKRDHLPSKMLFIKS